MNSTNRQSHDVSRKLKSDAFSFVAYKTYILKLMIIAIFTIFLIVSYLKSLLLYSIDWQLYINYHVKVMESDSIGYDEILTLMLSI